MQRQMTVHQLPQYCAVDGRLHPYTLVWLRRRRLTLRIRDGPNRDINSVHLFRFLARGFLFDLRTNKTGPWVESEMIMIIITILPAMGTVSVDSLFCSCVGKMHC